MPRITKGQIDAAHSELECIRELATEEGNWNIPCVTFHARSANNYIAVLVAAGQPLPGWIVSNWRFLRAHGWRGDSVLTPSYERERMLGTLRKAR